MRNRWLVSVGFMAATLVAAAPPADAQVIVGRVLERGGGGPVVGAMVRLESSDGIAGVGWLTTGDGRFRLEAPSGGTYSITVERIGFATSRRLGITVAENGMVSADIVVDAEAIALDGLEVSAAGGRCEVDPDGGAAQVLWDEARKALEAASWTEREVILRFVANVWDRQIDPRTSQILEEAMQERETFGANSVQSLDPDELLERGYIHTNPAYTYYYAPDHHVLLSDGFLGTHCFRVAESGEDSPYVGLHFEPDEDRDVPDVVGTLWLDAETGRLDRMEFGYAGVEGPAASRGKGEVHWAEMENGQWIVSEWFIQAPMSGGGTLRPGSVRRYGQNTIHEVGNSVELVEGEGFRWTPDFAPGEVRGTVYDSITRGPLAGAEVRVAGRGLLGRTDLDGRFEIAGVPPGRHRITFAHPDLDSIGVTAGFETVELEPGGIANVGLVVPSWVTLLARSCADGGALVGIVRTRSGELATGATVEVVDARDGSGQPYTDVTDSYGAYRLCGLPAGVTRVVARRAGATAEPSETRVQPDRPAQADLVLAPPPVQGERVPGAFRPALIGVVVAAGTDRPLEDVAVSLLDGAGDELLATLTEPDGSFRFLLEEGAEVYLRVSRLGYRGVVSEAIDLTDGTRRINVTLPEEAIELDPVVVEVDSRDPRLERQGFYERALNSPGMYVRRDDVEAVAPARTSDLLGRAPGVRVRTDALGADLRRRVTFQRIALTVGDRCWPSVFVDGSLARAGGSREESEAPVIEGIEPLIEEGSEIPSLDELVPPNEILAVEMYQNPGQVPMQFVGLGTRCGVIVIWTTRSEG